MISVDICDGRQTLCNIPVERIGEFLPAAPPPTEAQETKEDESAPEAAAQSVPVGASKNGTGGTAPKNDRVYFPGVEKGIRKGKKTVVWVDVTAPTSDDWKTLAEQFHFHPLAIEDAQNQNQRAKVDTYDGYLFLSVRAWTAGKTPGDEMHEVTDEIDIFLGPNYLVTIHNKDSEPINETRRRLERNPRHLRSQPAFLLYFLLDALVDEYFPAMDDLDVEIDKVETMAYETSTSTEVNLRPALVLKKRLLLLRQAISPLRDILNQLLRTDDTALMSPELRVFYQDVYDHTLRLVEQIDLHRDIMGGVMDAMMAQNSNRLNQVMKTMTAMSTLLMTVTLIAGIYGMNFDHMPELHWRYGYFYALAFMVAIGGGVGWYFKRIKWF